MTFKKVANSLALIVLTLLAAQAIANKIDEQPSKSPCLEYGMPTHSIIHVDHDTSTLIYECKGWMK